MSNILCVCECVSLRTHAQTPNLFSDDIKLCDNRQVFQPALSHVIKRIKSRHFPLNTVQYFETLLSERPKHFQALSMLTPQFGPD
jgi:hypothetical protein